MTRSTEVMKVIQKLIVDDISRKGDSRIGTFLTRNTKGGWEPWLQVEIAHALINSKLAADYQRECQFNKYAFKSGIGNNSAFSASDGICDIVVTPVEGAVIFIEVKTQRAGDYGGTLKAFQSDVNKLRALEEGFRKTYPCLAIAILQVNNNQQALNALRTPYGNHLNYYAYPPRNEKAGAVMEELTASIATYKPLVPNLLLAKWSNF